MNQALRERQKIPLEIVETFTRIPLSGILIKYLSLRALPFDFAQGREPVERRLCGEIVFGQE